MGGTERRGRKKSMARREGILRAALEEFCRAGYDAATMGEIAARAETSLATLYSYFTGKEDIARTLVLEGVTRLAYAVLAAQAAGGTAEEVVRRCVWTYMEWAARNPQWFRYLVKLAHLTPALTEPSSAAAVDATTNEMHGRAIANMAGYIARGEMRLLPERLYRPTVLGAAHFFLAFDWDGDATSDRFAQARVAFAEAAWRAVRPDPSSQPG